MESSNFNYISNISNKIDNWYCSWQSILLVPFKFSSLTSVSVSHILIFQQTFSDFASQVSNSIRSLSRDSLTEKRWNYCIVFLLRAITLGFVDVPSPERNLAKSKGERERERKKWEGNELLVRDLSIDSSRFVRSWSGCTVSLEKLSR